MAELGREPKKGTEIQWGLYNWGILQAVFHLRRDAVQYAKENHLDWPAVYEIHKVRVTPIKAARRGRP